jgi:single-strand DNA-binding protein
MPYGDTPVTIAGNLTADPELRYTQTGVAVAAFTIASSPRAWDQTSGQWRDGDALFLRCSAWRHLAEHIAESLTKGSRAVVTGRLRQRDYEAADGTRRTVYEVDVDDAGPSLRFATAKVTKTTRELPPHPANSDGRWNTAAPPTEQAPAAAGMAPPF